MLLSLSLSLASVFLLIDTSAALKCKELDDNNTRHFNTYKTDEDDCPACFVLTIVQAGVRKLEKAGCWKPQDDNCEQENCTLAHPGPAKKGNWSYLFCCCKQDMCNSYILEPAPPVKRPTTRLITPVAAVGEDVVPTTILPLLASLLAVSMAVVLAFLAYRCVRLQRRNSRADVLDCATEVTEEMKLVPDMMQSDCDLPLQLGAVLARGRFSTVYVGKLYDSVVAVKEFSEATKEQFVMEKYLYQLPDMVDHPNILQLMHSQSLPGESGCLYQLVLPLASLGSLCDYLEHSTLDWSQLVGMCRGLASGLAHLHSTSLSDPSPSDSRPLFVDPDIKPDNIPDVKPVLEYVPDSAIKPCIVHRDISSANVLVRADLEVVLADLGLARSVSGSLLLKSDTSGYTLASLSEITATGTPRYMAPELLEGAVNLRDCESSLKQIDVYAMAVVMWEISCRCTPLYQGAPVPPFSLAFTRELQSQAPSMARMLQLCRNNSRPLFPTVWKKQNQYVQLLISTICECWDSEPDARLTAACVVSRFDELASYSPRVTYTENRAEGRDEKNMTRETLPWELPLQPHQGVNPTQQRNLREVSEELSQKGNKYRPRNADDSSSGSGIRHVFDLMTRVGSGSAGDSGRETGAGRHEITNGLTVQNPSSANGRRDTQGRNSLPTSGTRSSSGACWVTRNTNNSSLPMVRNLSLPDASSSVLPKVDNA